jgi:tRNA dimethylallyltransferase
MSIGTAKPTDQELQGRPYHLVDYVEPDEVYSAAKFRDDALAAFAEIRQRGRTPFLVGGAGLYLRALTDGFFATPNTDDSYRAELENLGSLELHARLAEVDPESAALIPPGNRVRVIRALEIFHTTGSCKSELVNSGDYPRQPYRYMLLGLSCSRQKLYEKINARVDIMINEGFISEVSGLIEMGYDSSRVVRTTVGYREILHYLEDQIDLESAISLIKQHTRNYAKRQVTWFRKVTDLEEFDVCEAGFNEKLCRRLSKIKLDR